MVAICPSSKDSICKSFTVGGGSSVVKSEFQARFCSPSEYNWVFQYWEFDLKFRSNNEAEIIVFGKTFKSSFANSGP